MPGPDGHQDEDSLRDAGRLHGLTTCTTDPKGKER